MKCEEVTKEFVLSEVGKLQYLYGLKHEIRYAQSRDEKDNTESVAEHIYGMHILAMYFLPLLDPEHHWDKDKIYEMISLHDIDEIETGDVLGYEKTEQMKDQELEILKTVIEKSPIHMQAAMQQATTEYKKQKTNESKFVKAIDKFEPLVQLFCPEGKRVIHQNKTTKEQHLPIIEPYLREFSLMYSYFKIVHEAMIQEGFYYQEK